MNAPTELSDAVTAIAARLASAGVRHAFGIPGGEVLALIDALDRAGIRFVLARHETPAGFMAEGAWCASAARGAPAPGVLVTTVGPGLANAVNAVAQAALDRVPLVVLSAAIDADEALGFTHQVFDQRALLAPLVKASISVPAGAADRAIERAVALAMQAPHGPVHVELPVAVASAREKTPVVRSVPITSGVASRSAIDSLSPRLASAKRPLVLAGLGALVHGAGAEVKALAEALDAPVLTTYKAKGLVDERDARVVGAVALSPRADAIARPLLREADVVVLAGYDPIEMRRSFCDPFAPDAFVIDVCDAAPHHGVHRASVALVGDVRLTLEALASDVVSREPSWVDHTPARVRAELRAAFAPDRDEGPLALFHALRRALPDDAVLTVDTGAHRIAISQAFETRVPWGMRQSMGLCTMGYAIPAAIGAALEDPTRTLVAVAGDGGTDMVLGELATARDLGVSMIVVVIDDSQLALIEMKQRASKYPERGVSSGGTDYAAVARALGLRGVRADDAAALERAVREAMGAGGVTLVHCPVPRRAYDNVI